jgi:hypothetical protein
MKRTILTIVLGLLAFSGSAAVQAQSSQSYRYYGNGGGNYAAPVWNYPRYGGWGGGYHASTYEQGVLTGMGNLYRGAGEYEVANSVAAYNYQLARAASLQNSIAERQARAAVYASVRAGQERRHQENIKKNQSLAQFHARQQAAPLASHQINRQTGELIWPVALKNPQFSTDRTQIEDALIGAIDNHQVASGRSDQEFMRRVAALRAKLIEHREEFRPSEFEAARSFLDHLKNETAAPTTNNVALSF